MTRFILFAALSLAASAAFAAEFQTGQAARAVIGQTSFSARDASLTPTVLALSGAKLFVADASRRLLTFDLSQLPAPKEEPAPSAACPVCLSTPAATALQAVVPGVAAVSVWGHTIVAVDPQTHRVLIWKDSSAPRAFYGPDVQLGRVSDASPVSASTLVNPISAAFDGRRLFVGDAALHRVLVWNSLPSSDTQPADAILGQSNANLGVAPEAPSADSINRPSALASDGTNLYVADSLDHRVLVYSPADLPLPASAVLNSASMASGAMAPGTLVTLSGLNIASSSQAQTEGTAPLPSRLGGVEVFLNGNRIPLLATARSEIRAQLPYTLESASAFSLYVRIESADGSVSTTNAAPLKVSSASPGLFALAGPEPRSGVVLHLNDDGSASGMPVTTEAPAHPGETLIVWTIGLGMVDESDAFAVAGQPFAGPDAPVLHAVTATAGEHSAPVLSAVLPKDSLGIYQVRLTLPLDLPDNPQTPLVLSEEEAVSNTVTIPVRNSIR